MLSQISWGTLNGTRCPKSQPAILDQTVFKQRIFKLRTFSYKVQCSKDIIFTVITPTQTRVSVLHSPKLDKKEFLCILKKTQNNITLNICSQYSQPSPPNHTMQGLHTRVTTGSHRNKELYPSQQALIHWPLLKWHQVFELKPWRLVFGYFLLKDSISLYK